MQDDWTIKGRVFNDDSIKQIPLKNVICPACMETTLTKDLKLKDKSIFSNIKCQACKAANSSRKWLCECGCLWYKCSVHFRISNLSKISTKRICKRKLSERGLDLPFPKFRKTTYSDQHVFIEQAEINVWKPPQGSTIAMRFPHLVKCAAPT